MRLSQVGGYYSSGSAAEYLGASRSSIKRWVSNGQLRAVRSPLGWMYTREMLDEFYQRRRKRLQRKKAD